MTDLRRLFVICTLYIQVCGEQLLVGEGVVGYVVEVPREADVDKWALYYINGKLGFIVYRVLKK